MTSTNAHNSASGLRSGYTTGACAAAAAKGAALMLRHQITIREISIVLPGGVTATFALSGQNYSPDQASCFVVKDAGDDPDITNGAEIHACLRHSVDALPTQSTDISIAGGRGIGQVTKPGLAVPPGQWAINPVPVRMIEEAIRSVFPAPTALQVIISIPDGEERAKKTLNARLGIIGGLSILGTTGIVRPISAKAWTDTIDASLDVAKACRCQTVVLSTGRTSELAVQNYFRTKVQLSGGIQATLFDAPVHLEPCPSPLSEEAYVMMGDHVAYAVRACQQRGFSAPIIACQFAKLLKMACGHENTHAAASEMDLSRLLEWATTAQLPATVLDCISGANTAREIALACAFDSRLLSVVLEHARISLQQHTPKIDPQFMLADYNGGLVSVSP